ncbi:Protein of unknown function [Bacillus mycoides]|nr:Protein of unknown function [Bacillus mycoides]
MLVEEGPY